MRRRRIAQECIENDRVIFFVTAIQEMARIINRDVKFVRFQAKVFCRDRNNRRINFGDVHSRAVRRKIHWHNPNSETDAEHVIDIRHIGSGRSEEHTSELQSHSFISYAVFCLKKKKNKKTQSLPFTRSSAFITYCPPTPH